MGIEGTLLEREGMRAERAGRSTHLNVGKRAFGIEKKKNRRHWNGGFFRDFFFLLHFVDFSVPSFRKFFFSKNSKKLGLF